MASRVYLHLKANGIIPILLNGQQLHSDETRLLAAVHSAYSEQYSPESLEHYKQLPVSAGPSSLMTSTRPSSTRSVEPMFSEPLNALPPR